MTKRKAKDGSNRGREPRHGMTRSTTYQSWTAMKKRCFDPKDQAFARYGGRGIKVCERWQVFENFYADMGDRPVGLSLDRIDNGQGYEPGNCRWATAREQARNRTNNRMVEALGQVKCMAEWARDTGIPEDTLRVRILRLRWSPERAVVTPVAKRRPRVQWRA